MPPRARSAPATPSIPTSAAFRSCAQALIDYHRDLYGVEIADSRIAVTSSGMNAMMLIVQTLVSAGDNMVCVTPVWPNIFAAIQIQGGVARHVPLVGTDHGWELDLGRLFAACDERTKGIYIASPGNPTGWVMPEQQRRAILDFARERGIALIADEVYNRLIYNRRGRALLPGDRAARRSAVRGQQLLQDLGHDRLAGGLDHPAPRA